MNITTIMCDYLAEECPEIDSSKLKQETNHLKHTKFLNGSICESPYGLLFAYRTEQEPYFEEPYVHIVLLDNSYQPAGNSYTFHIPYDGVATTIGYKTKCHLERSEDPRLIMHGNHLVMFYCDGFKMFYLYLRPIIYDNDIIGMNILQRRRLHSLFDKDIHLNIKYDGREKNWTPFVKDDNLYVIYSYEPFIVYKLSTPDYEPVLELTTKTKINLNWKYGFIKGGTPAIRYSSNELITFFHSTLQTGYSYYYFMGALVFDENTLTPTKISRYPILTPSPVHDESDHISNFVVFPSGVVCKDPNYIITFGHNDRVNRILTLPRNVLEDNLWEACEIKE